MEEFLSLNGAMLIPFGVSCLFRIKGFPTTLVNGYYMGLHLFLSQWQIMAVHKNAKSA